MVTASAPAPETPGDAYRPPSRDTVLGTLAPHHPRLLLDDAGLAALRERLAAHPDAAAAAERQRKEAEDLLDAPPTAYAIPDGRRLLDASRAVMRRTYLLGLAYRLSGDHRFRDRLGRELEAAAGFKDWNPAHFLDTAEMTHALAVGYDWLHAAWTPAQRATFERAIAEKGLRPAQAVYAGRGWWSVNRNNWNQVCNGGIGLGALAIADVEPALCAEILERALASLPLAMRHYEPDGAGVEGVTYWHYGATYNVLLLAGLESALGTDFGLGGCGALGASGEYALQMSGAGRRTFDFGDCGVREATAAAHWWLARRYDRPEYAHARWAAIRAHPAEASPHEWLWFDPALLDRPAPPLPTERHFRGAECAAMRSGPETNATVVAIQGGANYEAHRHLDLGSFLFEADGVRWAVDPGVERETYMEHRNRTPRWDFYRTRAEAHNTIVVNPSAEPDQSPKAFAPIDRFEPSATGVVASVDLGQAYAAQATAARRTFVFEERRRLRVRDEFALKAPSEVWWFLNTRAEVRVAADGRSATLASGGRTLRIDLARAPAAARLDVRDGAPLPTSPNPSPQASNAGLRKLALRVGGVEALDLEVVLTPGGAGG